MSLLGYKASNHPQQVTARGPLSAVDDRATAWADFHPWHERFRFTIDVAASAENTKLERFYTIEEDGLGQSWARERVWCNPPYSQPNLERWVRKAWQEMGEPCTMPELWSIMGPPVAAELIVMLVPANRTEQRWWQEHVEPYRDRPDGQLRVEFLPGRMRFVNAGKAGIGPNERPPFGCCLLIWSSASCEKRPTG